MPPISQGDFADLLGDLSVEQRREFLADLYAARGWETRVQGGSVRARNEGTVRELRLDTDLTSGDAGTGTDGTADVRVLDAVDLYRVCLYGIDREDCDALFREHFGRPLPPSEEGPDGTIARPTGADSEEPSRGRESRRDRRTIVLVLIATLGLIGGTGAYAAVGGLGSLDSPQVDSAPTDPAAEGGGPAETATPTDSTPFPPGLTREGVTEPGALGAAHEASIDGEGYVLLSNRTVRYENGTVRSRLALRVALGVNDTYLAEAATAGPHAPKFLGLPPARATYWSNGTLYLRRAADGNATTYNSFVPPNGDVASPQYWVSTVAFGGRVGNRPGTFFESVFASVPTRIEVRTPGPTDTYRLVNRGTIRTSDPPFAGEVSNVRDVVLIARVDERGVVRSLHLGYTGVVGGETVRVDRDIAYRAIGNTTVGRPPWFERATRE